MSVDVEAWRGKAAEEDAERAAGVLRPNRLIWPLFRIGNKTEPIDHPANHVSLALLCDQFT